MKDASAFALSDVSIHAREEFSAFSYISIDFCPHRMCEYMHMVDDVIMGPWWRNTNLTFWQCLESTPSVSTVQHVWTAGSVAGSL
jgi:predicted membrane protein